MSGATSIVMAGAAVAGAAMAGYSAYQGKREGDRQEAEAKRQLEQAKKAENQADQQFNREHQRNPDISGLLQDNTGMGNATQLVGAGSAPIDPNTLGKGNGLLGG